MKEQFTATAVTDEYGKLYFDVSYNDPSGSIIEKRLSSEDFTDLIEGSVRKQEVFRVIPRLPEEVVWAAIGSAPDTFQAILVVPESVRPVYYMGQILENIPFPRLCMHVQVTAGHRMDSNLYALDGKAGGNAELLWYPYGNCTASTGRTCFGNIVVDNIKGPEESRKVLEAFLEGATNGDLWNGFGGFESQADLYEAVKGKKKFPIKKLPKLGITLDDLIRECKKNIA